MGYRKRKSIRRRRGIRSRFARKKRTSGFRRKKAYRRRARSTRRSKLSSRKGITEPKYVYSSVPITTLSGASTLTVYTPVITQGDQANNRRGSAIHLSSWKIKLKLQNVIFSVNSTTPIGVNNDIYVFVIAGFIHNPEVNIAPAFSDIFDVNNFPTECEMWMKRYDTFNRWYTIKYMKKFKLTMPPPPGGNLSTTTSTQQTIKNSTNYINMRIDRPQTYSDWNMVGSTYPGTYAAATNQITNTRPFFMLFNNFQIRYAFESRLFFDDIE